MEYYLTRYICSNKDLDNKVVFYTVDIYKDEDVKIKLKPLPFSLATILVSGIPLSKKGGRFDALNKGHFHLKESDWKELEKYLYDTVDVIESCDNDTFELMTRYNFVTEQDLVKFLKERAFK
jgi:hypothetical protein